VQEGTHCNILGGYGNLPKRVTLATKIKPPKA